MPSRRPLIPARLQPGGSPAAAVAPVAEAVHLQPEGSPAAAPAEAGQRRDRVEQRAWEGYLTSLLRGRARRRAAARDRG
jgi:hypothetical protein